MLAWQSVLFSCREDDPYLVETITPRGDRRQPQGASPRGDDRGHSPGHKNRSEMIFVMDLRDHSGEGLGTWQRPQTTGITVEKSEGHGSGRDFGEVGNRFPTSPRSLWSATRATSTCDPTGAKALTVNPKVKALTGIQQAEALTKPWMQEMDARDDGASRDHQPLAMTEEVLTTKPLVI